MGKFCSLASGSLGNCYFFSTEKTKILIDFGLSVKQTKIRLEAIGESLEEIQAILISHEHHDHIAGLKVFLKNYKIPIFANYETAKALFEQSKLEHRFHIFTTNEPFLIEDLEIRAFNVTHDAVDPCGFSILSNETKWVFLADCGFITSLILEELKGVNHLLIEANHEIDLIDQCSRPDVYKKRVKGKQGHLSNQDCYLTLKKIAHQDLRSVILAHLSSECNEEQKAISWAKKALCPKTKLLVAKQQTPTEVICF